MDRLFVHLISWIRRYASDSSEVSFWKSWNFEVHSITLFFHFPVEVRFSRAESEASGSWIRSKNNERSPRSLTSPPVPSALYPAQYTTAVKAASPPAPMSCKPVRDLQYLLKIGRVNAHHVVIAAFGTFRTFVHHTITGGTNITNNTRGIHLASVEDILLNRDI